jgi:hypothetical protein
MTLGSNFLLQKVKNKGKIIYPCFSLQKAFRVF